jgi:DNA polymerase III subunit gamma/tau
MTSLYRRFRPGRFAELRGQDHVVRALQGATRSNRVAHAYLFSGPRGTGKTTAARILAKALNCEHLVDGDACDECASCVAITQGSSLDVIELDAASNNGVEDMREITAGAWHGTPGRWKVYIFDEVHMLSKAASAALLKTLEEPPAHVVFVLATTDPHKVLPTIRSRTQHLEFRLMGPEILSSLLHEVQAAADLKADDGIIESAVRLGRGSARDALSALDRLVATGADGASQPEFDAIFHALVHADAVAALSSLATLTRQGWEPEQLVESFVAEVRQAFLLQVAPGVADAADADRDRLAAWGEQLGLARTVRVLETFGRALRDMKSAPDKIVTLEVALVRLIKPELDTTVEALEERLARLERGVSRPASVPEPPAPKRPIGSTATAPSSSPPPDPAPEAPEDRFEPDVAPPQSFGAPALSIEDVRERFEQRVVPRTARSAQLVLKNCWLRDLDGRRLVIALPNEEMRQSTEMITPGLRGALEHEFKMSFAVEWTVDPAVFTTGATRTRTAKHDAPEPVEDDSYGADESSIVVDSAAEHLITEMFPGAEEIS